MASSKPSERVSIEHKNIVVIVRVNVFMKLNNSVVIYMTEALIIETVCIEQVRLLENI